MPGSVGHQVAAGLGFSSLPQERTHAAASTEGWGASSSGRRAAVSGSRLRPTPAALGFGKRPGAPAVQCAGAHGLRRGRQPGPAWSRSRSDRGEWAGGGRREGRQQQVPSAGLGSAAVRQPPARSPGLGSVAGRRARQTGSQQAPDSGEPLGRGVNNQGRARAGEVAIGARAGPVRQLRSATTAHAPET